MDLKTGWIPAFAGMTENVVLPSGRLLLMIQMLLVIQMYISGKTA